MVQPMVLLGLVAVCLCASASARAAGIAWHESLGEALEAAKQSGKLVLVDFYAEWCEPCKMLEAETFPAPRVVEASEAYECVRVDTDKHPDVAARYGVEGIPNIQMLTPDGAAIHGMVGFYPAEPFADTLTTALALPPQLAALKQRPEDPRANYELAMTYLALQRSEDALPLFQKVLKAVRPARLTDAAERNAATDLRTGAQVGRDACGAVGAKPRSAIHRLEQFVARNPQSAYAPLAKWHIAMGYFALDEYDRARKCAEELIAAHGDSAWAGRAKLIIERVRELEA